MAYERHIFDLDDKAAWERLSAVDPLAQVPTLVTDDGNAMTESAAIALWLADRRPEVALLPRDVAARSLAKKTFDNACIAICIAILPHRWNANNILAEYRFDNDEWERRHEDLETRTDRARRSIRSTCGDRLRAAVAL